MFNKEKQKLIVVVNDKTAVYGELLSALVSMRDDKYDENGNLLDGGIIGVRDDSVDVVVWNEKTYVDNQPKLGSSNKIIFIGRMKATKSIEPNLNMKGGLHEFGIYSGSLGNKAMIYANADDLARNRDIYNKFIDSYAGFISSIATSYASDQVVEKKFVIEDYEDKERTIIKKIANAPIKLINKILPKKKKEESIEDNAVPEMSDNVADGTRTAGHVVRMSLPHLWPAEIVQVVVEGLTKSNIVKTVNDQQYRYGIFAFYINKLAKFME